MSGIPSIPPASETYSPRIADTRVHVRVELFARRDVKKLGDGRYSGRFANQPRDLPGKRAGDLVQFADADISDWMFMRNGKIVGGETIKPLLKSMPKADADALRARMETP